jgi:putative tricarboxylic transport membrane protein
MKNPDQTSSLFWLVVGMGITITSLKYGFGAFLSPGPGFITFFAGTILSFLSLILLVSSIRNRKLQTGLGDLWKGLEVGKAIYVLSLLAVYALVLQTLGFLVSTFLLLSLLFRVKAKYSFRRVIILSFLISTGAYLLFDFWLRVPLPKGVLERIF